MSLLREEPAKKGPSRWEMLTSRPKAGPPKARNMAHDADRLYDNKLEAAYAEHLEADRQAGKILRWWPKPMKFRLANKCWYNADFMVQALDGSLAIHETKGFLREDAHLKLKFLTKEFPFPVVMIQKEKCKGGFIWKETLYTP